MEPSGSLETMAEECFRDERFLRARSIYPRQSHHSPSPLNHPLAEGVQVARRII